MRAHTATTCTYARDDSVSIEKLSLNTHGSFVVKVRKVFVGERALAAA